MEVTSLTIYENIARENGHLLTFCGTRSTRATHKENGWPLGSDLTELIEMD